MSASKEFKTVQEAMQNGKNCCQAVLMASGEAFNLPMGEDIQAAASLFGYGIGSGCTCGALVGMVMVSGIFQQYQAHPLGKKLSVKLHDDFKKQFGSTCCRVIKKQRHNLIGSRACIELTAQATDMLVKEWEGILNAEPIASIYYNSDSK